MVLERDVEAALVRFARDAGGRCVKFIPDMLEGMPDRIVMLPGSVLVWVELKRPRGGVLSEIQKHRHKQLRALGQHVEVCWSKEEARRIVDAYRVLPHDP